MEHTEKAFLNHVKGVLQDYEFDYAAGAWERFQKQEHKKKYAIWLKWAYPVTTAAVLFLVLLITITTVSDKKKVLYTRSEKPKIIRSGRLPGNEKPTSITTEKNAYLKPAASKKKPIHSKNIGKSDIGVKSVLAVSKFDTTSKKDNYHQEMQIAEEKRPLPERSNKNRYKDLTYTPISDSKSTSADNQGLKIMVAVSNNFNAVGSLTLGFSSSAEYAINKNLSVAAGAGYTKISGVGKFDQPSTLLSRSLSSVETSVSGIDLPLDLKYNLNKHHYISLGVSALAITRKSQVLNYTENKLIDVTMNGTDGPITESKLITTTEAIPVAAETLPQQKYLSFYNFSYGFIQNVGKNNRLIFEPYIKLPMKTYSEQRTNLISTGIRLKIQL